MLESGFLDFDNMKALRKLKLRGRISYERSVNEYLTVFVIRFHGHISRFRAFSAGGIGAFARLKFAGQSLSLGNLVLGQSGLQCRQAHFDVQSMLIVLRGRKSKPFVSLHLILGHTFTLLVASSEFILRGSQPTFGGTPNPFDTFFDVLWYPGPLKVTVAELILRGCETLPSRFAEPI